MIQFLHRIGSLLYPYLRLATGLELIERSFY